MCNYIVKWVTIVFIYSTKRSSLRYRPIFERPNFYNHYELTSQTYILLFSNTLFNFVIFNKQMIRCMDGRDLVTTGHPISATSDFWYFGETKWMSGRFCNYIFVAQGEGLGIYFRHIIERIPICIELQCRTNSHKR